MLKRVTSDAAHLRSLVPGLSSFEEISQRWQAVGDTVSDLPRQESIPRPPSPIAMCLTIELTGISIFFHRRSIFLYLS